MLRKGVLCIGILTLLVVFSSLFAHAEDGGYVVMPGPPHNNTTVPADSGSYPISFWQLPLWVQLFHVGEIGGAIVACALVALKLVPLALLKLREKLRSDSREAIYRQIERNPGTTVSEIARDHSMNAGSVRYHVEQLESAQRIMHVFVGKFKRLFRNSGAYNRREIEVISALHVRTNKAIVCLVREHPGLSNKEIAERLEINESMAHLYLTRLMEDAIIRCRQKGQSKLYYIESDAEAIMGRLDRLAAGNGFGT